MAFSNDKRTALISLLTIMGSKWQKSFLVLTCLSVFAAALDAASIIIFTLASFNSLENLLTNDMQSEIIAIFFIFISAVTRGLLQYLQIKFSFLSAVILGDRVFSAYLSSQHSSNESVGDNRVISTITTRLNTVSGNIILSSLQIINFLAFSIFLLFGLIFFNIYKVLVVLFIVVLIFFSIYVGIKPITKQLGVKVNTANTSIVTLVNEATQLWELIRLRMQEQEIASRYSALETNYRKNLAIIGFLATLPKYGVEIILALSLGLLLVLNSTSESLDLMGFIALGYAALRAIPIVQQAYNGLTLMLSGHASLREIIDIIKEFEANVKPIKGAFSLSNITRIEARNIVSKRIINSDRNPIFLDIKNGEKITVTGNSGSGKSTLIKMLTGLTSADDNTILYNGHCINRLELSSLYKQIAYLPQVAPLVNGTFDQNILHGVESNFDKNLYDELIKLVGFTISTGEVDEHFLARQVGDRGKNLSGGQRQRIQIVNTLLMEKKIIIFDEATSALDANLEQKIIKHIFSQTDLTVIVITHNEKIKALCENNIELN